MTSSVKVYPEMGSPAMSLSLPRAQSQNSDLFLQDVDKEMQAIVDEADQFAASMSTTATPNTRLKKRLKPAARSRAGSVDGVDDVRLSHEIAQNEAHVTKQLDESINVIARQIDEYKKLYCNSNTRLKDIEAKKTELELSLDEALEDNERLMEEIQQLRTHHGIIPVAHSTLSNITNMRASVELQNRSEELRKALMFEDEDDDNMAAISSDELWRSKDFKRRLTEWINNIMPFKKDITKVQSRYGSSVASYYIFYRFLFIQFTLAAMFVIFFLLVHIFQFVNDGATLNSFFESPGYLPGVMLYSSFSVSEGLNYDLCILFVLFFIMTTLMVKLVAEDEMAKTMETMEAENFHPYSKEILSVWDFSMKCKIDVDDFSNNIGNKILQQMEETKVSGIKEARSKYQSFLVYMRRVLGTVLYLSVLGASFVIILYVTLYSSYIASKASIVPGLSNLQSFIAPLILTSIAAVMPEISKAITDLEAWDSAQTITTINLLRVYISSLLNTLLLVFSYLVLADPFLLANSPALRNSFGLTASEDFDCLLDQAADGLFTLVVFQWLLNNIVIFAMPYIMMLVAPFTLYPYRKLEFLVADNMVKKLNLTALMLATVPFSPLAFIFMPFMWALGFMWEKAVMRRHYAKPTIQFSGQKAGLVYTFFYCCTFLAVGITMAGYFFTTKTFAKSCDVQDNYVHLCSTAQGTNDVCGMSSSNQYYQFYRGTQYPAAICHKACGAFVNDASNFGPFQFRVSALSVMSYVWSALFDYPYIPWVAVMALALWVARARNSLLVLHLAWFHKEQAFVAQLQTNEGERKKQEKIIRRLKTLEGGERKEQ